MASKDFAILDIQNDNDELQFQDFGLSGNSNRDNSQTHVFTDFPDSPGHHNDREKKERGPLCKKMKLDPGQQMIDEKNSSLASTDPDHPDINLKKISKECMSKFSVKNISDGTKEEMNFGTSLQTSVKLAFSDPANPKGFGSIQYASSTHSYPTLTKANTTIEAILAENVKGSVVLVDVLVLHVKDKRLISKAVQNLSICRPVADLRHLKKVNIVKIDEYECSQEPEVDHETSRTVVEEEKNINCNNGVCKKASSRNDQKVGLKDLVKKEGSNVKEMNSCSRDMVLLYVDLLETLINFEEVLHIVGENCFSGYKIDKTTITDVETKECSSESLNFRNLFPVNNSKVVEILMNKLRSLKIDMSLFSDVLYVSKVSKHPPRLRHLFNKATEYWPCTFHEDAYLTKMLTGGAFDEHEVEQVIANMNRTLSLARKCSLEMRSLVGLVKCTPQTPMTYPDCVSVSPKKDAAQHVLESSEVSQNLNSSTENPFQSFGMDGVSTSIDNNSKIDEISRSSCILYDGSKNCVMVEAVDSLSSHPLAHAAMVAVDLVGHQLGGGAWEMDAKGVVSPKEHISTSTKTANNDHLVNNPYFLTSTNVVCAPLSGGAGSGNIRVCSDNTTAHQRDDAGRDNIKECDHRTKQQNSASVAGGISGSTSSNVAANTTVRSSSSASYICTGLDAYLSHEPCMMCAMALLHSRVRRVFYCLPNAAKGALGSVVRLHTMQGVNHRYEVFRVRRRDGLGMMRIVDYEDCEKRLGGV